MIPKDITRDNLRAAISFLAEKGWPKKRKSTRYDLVHEGRSFPPKEVVRVAAAIAQIEIGRYWGGKQTNDFLRSRGFVVVGEAGSLLATVPSGEDEEAAFPEGAAAYRTHLRRERSGSAPKLAKERRLRETGDLKCDVCDFSFVEVYGERGAGFIEAHHNRPLSEVRTAVKTRPSDLALVCSNCHRMLHRMRPWMNVKHVRTLIRRQRAGGQRTLKVASDPR